MNLKHSGDSNIKNHQNGQLNHGGRATVRTPMAKPKSTPTVMPKMKSESQRLGVMEDRGQR